MKKIAVFVDGSNFFYTQKKLGWRVDMEKLLEYCRQFGDIVEATYYSGTSNDEGQTKFHNWLAHIGYSIVTKPLKIIYDHNNGQTTVKANLDIEIVIDMFNMIDRYDTVILISGDGDFQRALQQLKSRGKEVKIISTSGCVASELMYTVGINYIDWLNIKSIIERKQSEKQSSSLAIPFSIV